MKMMRIFTIMMSLFLLASCNKEESGSGLPQETTFQIQVTDVTSTSCVVTVLPSNQEQPYLCVVIDATGSGETDEDFIADDLAWWKQFSDNPTGEELYDVLMRNYMHQGTQRIEQVSLTPGTEYQVYVCEFDPDSKEFGKGSAQQLFRTL